MNIALLAKAGVVTAASVFFYVGCKQIARARKSREDEAPSQTQPLIEVSSKAALEPVPIKAVTQHVSHLCAAGFIAVTM